MNHVRRIAASPDVSLTLVSIGETYQARIDQNIPQHSILLPDRKCKKEPQKYGFPHENRVKNKDDVTDIIRDIVTKSNIDVVIVDYLFSSLFFDYTNIGAKSVLITLNREVEFYQDMISLGIIPGSPETNAISIERLRRFEQDTASAVDQVVTLAPPDLPHHPLKNPPRYITPYLDQPPSGWRYTQSAQCFFVGSIHHYPNRQAMDWLATQLAPRLETLDPTIQIMIVGAAPGDAPPHWQRLNITFLGHADAETVSTLFQTADLMLCPVFNDYGVKFKAVEALAHGTPLLGSHATLSGFPHLTDMPALDLDAPDESARIICDLIRAPEKLQDFQQRQSRQQQDFVNTQADVWSRLLKTLTTPGKTVE